MPNIVVSSTINSFLISSNGVVACSALKTPRYEVTNTAYTETISTFPANNVNGNVFSQILYCTGYTDSPVAAVNIPYIDSYDNDNPSYVLRTPTVGYSANQLYINIYTYSGDVYFTPVGIFDYTNIEIFSQDTNNNNDTIIVNANQYSLPYLETLSVYCSFSEPILINIPISLRNIYLTSNNAGSVTNLDININIIAAQATAPGGFLYVVWNGFSPTSASQAARNALTARGWILTFS
jgi:hypothetical protein